MELPSLMLCYARVMQKDFLGRAEKENDTSTTQSTTAVYSHIVYSANTRGKSTQGYDETKVVAAQAHLSFGRENSYSINFGSVL